MHTLNHTAALPDQPSATADTMALFGVKTPFAVPRFAEGRGEGLVEAARGALGHWIAVSSGRISHYQIVAPTTWNFSPRDAAGVPGPLEQALAGTPVGADGAGAPAVQHVVRSFDPCMVCTAH